MELGEAIRQRRIALGMSQAALAKAAGVDPRQIRRYEAGEQQPLFTAAVAIAAVLRIPLAELAGLPAEPAAARAPRRPRIRHGIEFSARDDSNGELRVTGDDDAAVLLWAAAWLDEHRDWAVTGITFRYPAFPGTRGPQRPSPGTPSAEDMRPRGGAAAPWSPSDARVGLSAAGGST